MSTWINHLLTSKFCKSSCDINIRCGKSFCDDSMLVFIENEFSIIIYSNQLCHSQSENGFQIPIRMSRKTIFDIQATILLKD